MTAYDSLLELQKELKIWDTVSSVSFWDQLTVMPKDASPYRAEQNACLAKTKHRLQTSNEYEEQLFKAWTEVQASEGHSDRYIQVKRLKEEFERNRKLSTDLVSRLAKASVQGSAAWEEAKEAGDSSIFLRELENLVDLAKEKADAYGFSDNPYDGLIGDFEQGMNTEDFDKLYTPLKDQLADLVKEAHEDQGYRQVEGRFDLNAQDRLGRSLAEDLGFSFANGAIMTSSHPFLSQWDKMTSESQQSTWRRILFLLFTQQLMKSVTPSMSEGSRKSTSAPHSALHPRPAYTNRNRCFGRIESVAALSFLIIGIPNSKKAFLLWQIGLEMN